MLNSNNISKIWTTDDAIWIQLADGTAARELFADYPRLSSADNSSRQKFSVSRFGLHWPELDEDLSFDGFFKNNR